MLVAAPHEGPFGRNNGAVVWGDITGGKLTLLRGRLRQRQRDHSSPLFSGRVRLALLDPEPGFWGNGSYFGDKDMLSIRPRRRSSRSTAAPRRRRDKDWAEINVDGLIEKKLGGGSFVTAEGAYYHYNVNDGGVSDSLLRARGLRHARRWASATSSRWSATSAAKVKGPTATKPGTSTSALSYLIKGPALRLLATYGHTKLGASPARPATWQSANSIQLGAQAIFF